MTYYRLYFRGATAGGPIRGVEEIFAADDGEAHHEAEKHVGRDCLELWSGARKVSSLPRTSEETGPR